MADTADFDLTRDQEWARYGDELEWGTELIVEWGVQFSRSTGSRVSLYGVGDDAKRQARAFVASASATPVEDLTVTVVARRVLYGPWGERNG